MGVSPVRVLGRRWDSKRCRRRGAFAASVTIIAALACCWRTSTGTPGGAGGESGNAFMVTSRRTSSSSERLQRLQGATSIAQLPSRQAPMLPEHTLAAPGSAHARDIGSSSTIRIGMRLAGLACQLRFGLAAATRQRRTTLRVVAEDCEFKLYPQRWVQLALLALLAMISDLVCFSVAATPETWKSTFGQDPAILLDIFLFTNVAACFVEPTIVRKFGLRLPIVGAAALMAIGCLVRSGNPFADAGLPDYTSMVIGTVLVGAAQPFFQCTPPLLSATWFSPSERALSTAIAINFNQVGIAAAFLLGGEMALSASGLKEYFSLITVFAVVVLVASALAFQEKPESPPSASELEKEQNPQGEDISFPEQAMQLLKTPGFLQPLTAFVCSIMVTNVIGGFAESRLVAAGIVDQRSINFSGASFELGIVLGGIVLGGIVDQNKEYKSVTLACLVATFAALAIYGTGMAPPVLVIAALLAIGALAGPVQPINAELAVEATYPADENAIEAVQQLCGNLASALLIPVCAYAAGYTVPLPFLPSGGAQGAGLGGDSALLMALVLLTTGYFSTFNARLRRTETDEACEVKIPEVEEVRARLERQLEDVEVDGGRPGTAR